MGGKMETILVAGTLLLSQLAYAGGPSITIAVGYSGQPPAARMQVLADYVAVPINIQNDSKDPIKRGDEIEKAYIAIADKLASHQDLKVMPGAISLSPREQGKFSSSDSYRGSSAQLYVLGSLKPDTNIFAVTKRIYQIVTAIPLADGTKVTLGNTSLGLDEPEKYRNQLLGLISKSVADAKKSLGSTGSIDIEGLESPVTVMQWSDRELLLFISYRFRLQTKAI
jgi:hypothetical protein